MTDDELERLLATALDEKARAEIGDSAIPPPPQFDELPHHPRRRHRLGRAAAPLLAAAAVIAVVAVLLGVVGSGPRPAAGRPVLARAMALPSGAVGVGMPVIAYFSRQFTDARQWQAATRVSVDGRPVVARWYFERGVRTAPVVGHLRMRHYWPAHATVSVNVRARGLSAGAGASFASDLHLNFRTGAAQIATVRESTHSMRVTRDGKLVADFPVSLGAPATPTRRGIKVVMQKDPTISMHGPGYRDANVRYAQQLTFGGEYLHSAPWNVYNIEHGIDSSNGCTNLLPRNARMLYRTLQIGDVIEYPDASGPMMGSGDGYGDWDVPWSQWRTGGPIPTT